MYTSSYGLCGTKNVPFYPQAMPGQLFFGRNMILNTLFIADWEGIRQCKQKLIEEIKNLKIKTINGTHIEYWIKY